LLGLPVDATGRASAAEAIAEWRGWYQRSRSGRRWMAVTGHEPELRVRLGRGAAHGGWMVADFTLMPVVGGVRARGQIKPSGGRLAMWALAVVVLLIAIAGLLAGAYALGLGVPLACFIVAVQVIVSRRDTAKLWAHIHGAIDAPLIAPTT
jgi:hypothetical protein